jgi:hypothetical protein
MKSTDDKDVQQSIKYRGTILELMSVLEAWLGVYLAQYFCGNNKDKVRNIQLLLFGDERITLSNKAQVFHFIATEYDKIWYDNYISNRPKQAKKLAYTMNQDLVYIIEQRNIFAHRLMAHKNLDHISTKPENVLRLARVKNEFAPLDYDVELFNLICKTISTLSLHLYERCHVSPDL